MKSQKCENKKSPLSSFTSTRYPDLASQFASKEIVKSTIQDELIKSTIENSQISMLNGIYVNENSSKTEEQMPDFDSFESDYNTTDMETKSTPESDLSYDLAYRLELSDSMNNKRNLTTSKHKDDSSESKANSKLINNSSNLKSLEGKRYTHFDSSINEKKEPSSFLRRNVSLMSSSTFSIIDSDETESTEEDEPNSSKQKSNLQPVPITLQPPPTDIQFLTPTTPAPVPAELDCSKLVFIENPKAKSSVPAYTQVLGRTYSDYMCNIKWTKEKGWEAPVISAFGNISISPAATIFHYALGAFEGMKAYKSKDGSVRLFRPEKNMERMNKSCERLCLPTFNSKELIKIIQKLIEADYKHIPYSSVPGWAMYIRPHIYSTHPFVAIETPEQAEISILMFPVCSFFSTAQENSKLKIAASTTYARSFPGSAADHKLVGNYAPCMKPTNEAKAQGYSQILWLHKHLDDYIVTEVGTMNIFFYWKNTNGQMELVTPKLENNFILPGITRMSIIEIAQSYTDLIVKEETLYMKKDIVKAFEEGRMYEVFGAGTVSSVCPINTILFNNIEYNTYYYKEYGPMGMGPIVYRFSSYFHEIQYGHIDHPWAYKL